MFEDVKPGDMIGRWRVLRAVGEGGFGAVFEVATDAVPGRTRALKLVRESPRRSREFQLIVRQLQRHPSIAPIVDFVTPSTGAPQNSLALVMPFARQSLRDHVDRIGPLREHQARAIFDEIANALAFLHTAEPSDPIAHSDIKPENIIQVGKQWKLTDFGIAVVCDDYGAGPAVGYTPGYAAPELMSIGRASPAADIYALGATLVRCMWPSGAEPAVLLASLGSGVVGAPAELAARCLSSADSERPTAVEFSRSLDQFERDPKYNLALALMDLYAESKRGPDDPVAAARVGDCVGHACPRSSATPVAADAARRLVAAGRNDVARFLVNALETLESRTAMDMLGAAARVHSFEGTFDLEFIRRSIKAG